MPDDEGAARRPGAGEGASQARAGRVPGSRADLRPDRLPRTWCYVPTVTDTTGFESNPPEMDAALTVLQAVADPIRWTVLSVLAAGPQCVCSLQGEVPIAGNLLSYHLKVLREAGLITSSRRGRWVDYALADDAQERMTCALPGAPAWCRHEHRRAGPRPNPGATLGRAGCGGGRLVRAVRPQRAVLDLAGRRRRRAGPDQPAGLGGAVLRRRLGEDRAAAGRDHLRRHRAALVHERGAHPGAAGRQARGRRQRDGRGPRAWSPRSAPARPCRRSSASSPPASRWA